MFNTIVDLENQLKTLKKIVQPSKKIGEDDLDRMKYIGEELKGIVEEMRND